MWRVRLIFTLLVPGGLLAACGGGGDGGTIGSPAPPPGGGTVPAVTVSDVFTQLAFSAPTVLKQAPGDTSRWFVGEKSGRILVFASNTSSSAAEVFLDLGAVTDDTGEGGLLGFAFHPDFPVTPVVYVSYTRGGPFRSRVSRFFSNDNGLTLDRVPEEIILEIPQPATNHNGGDIAFGPDGYLYIGLGDGGGSGDPQGNGQNDMNLHGTIVRLDVSGLASYAIPPGNPNEGNAICVQGAGAAPCPEIFAWGLRNPWRFSFDPVTGSLWAADVGQGDWEEVDLIEAGNNYGWNEREGAHCFNPASGCSTAYTDPVTEYGRSLGRSVTGGYVYRGSGIADLVGWYVFGDFASGNLFAIPASSAPGVEPEVLLDTNRAIVTFGEDVDGELYFMDYSVGKIHKLETAP
jgi:glucose/arabinose dehydrogenase